MRPIGSNIQIRKTLLNFKEFVENIVKLSTIYKTIYGAFRLIKMLFENLHDDQDLLVSTVLQVAKFAPTGLSISNREKDCVLITFHVHAYHTRDIFFNMAVSKVHSHVTEIGKHIGIPTETLIQDLVDNNMFAQAKQLIDKTGVIPRPSTRTEESWKLNLVKPACIIKIFQPIIIKDNSRLVDLLYEKSLVDAKLVYKLLDGELLKRKEFTKIVHNASGNHAIFKLFLAYRHALTHLLSTQFSEGVRGIVDNYWSPAFGEFTPFEKCFPMTKHTVFEMSRMIVSEEEQDSCASPERKKRCISNKTRNKF